VNPQKYNLKQIGSFEKKSGRKDTDYLLSLNESRFENIDKSPSVISKNVKSPSFSFNKQTERVNDLFMQNLYTSQDQFGRTEPGVFYETSKEKIMKRLNAGVPDIKRQSFVPKNEGGEKRNLSCVDVSKAVDAKTTKLRPKYVNYSNFKTQRARDDSMLKESDRYDNLQLDHSKEQREFRVQASRKSRHSVNHWQTTSTGMNSKQNLMSHTSNSFSKHY